MLSKLLTTMLGISFFFGLLLGNMGAVSSGAVEGALAGAEMGIKLAGPLCLWCGVGELLARSGLREKLGVILMPLLGRLFPRLRQDREGFSALCANVTANLLGLGNAATPMGIQACQAMGDGSGSATREQCRLIVLNTASIQLLPTTVMAIRASLESPSPGDIIPAVLLTSLFALTAGMGLCLLLERMRHE